MPVFDTIKKRLNKEPKIPSDNLITESFGQQFLDRTKWRPSLPSLDGFYKNDILAALSTLSQDGSNPSEMSGYLHGDCDRFIYTVGMIPNLSGSALEIGAAPYFTSLLLKWFRKDILTTYTNFFAANEGWSVNNIAVTSPWGKSENHEMAYANLNVEQSEFPFEDNSFDLVLFCEVIEHLLMDPLHCLREIWRVLKPGGRLVLTTPNVARLENVARIVAGISIYDPYSAYGPYGRHNKEYTVKEITDLLSFSGFNLIEQFTADVLDIDINPIFDVDSLAPFLHQRQNELGYYIFSTWEKTKQPQLGRPNWLYRSYPANELVDVSVPQ